MQKKRLRLLKCYVARAFAAIYIFAEVSDWSKNEEHLQQRSARAFRPLPRAGPAHARCVCLRLETLAFQQTRKARLHLQHQVESVKYSLFRYPRAFNCFTTTYCCGTYIYDLTWLNQQHIRKHEARQVCHPTSNTTRANHMLKDCLKAARATTWLTERRRFLMKCTNETVTVELKTGKQRIEAQQ